MLSASLNKTLLSFLHSLSGLIVVFVLFQFFNQKGVHDVPSPEKLFNDITNLDIQGTGADFVAQVRRTPV